MTNTGGNFRISGWVDFVVEVRYIGTPEQWFSFVTKPPMFCEPLPSATGGERLGAMLEGENESSGFVRVAAPASGLLTTMLMLHQALTEAFPRPPEG